MKFIYILLDFKLFKRFLKFIILKNINYISFIQKNNIRFNYFKISKSLKLIIIRNYYTIIYKNYILF